jgi:hypothetical protein
MKNLKVKLSALAVIMAVSGAFATMQPKHFAAHKWGRDPLTGVYTDITGETEGQQYNCDDSPEICTATYPAGQDPNSNPASPLSVENGLFN